MTSIIKQVLIQEAKAIQDAATRLDDSVEALGQHLAKQHSPIIFCGVGKSGLVAQKLAATFTSIGQAAVYLHAGEATHGDLGVVQNQSTVILISNSGATQELVTLIPHLKQRQCTIAAIIGRTKSPIGNTSDYIVDASVEREADPHNVLPSNSSTLAMAIGDALAIYIMEKKKVTPDTFYKNHPGGQLGLQSLTVKEVMVDNTKVGQIGPAASIKEIAEALTSYPMGAIFVVENTTFLGLVTDGDMRRLLTNPENIQKLRAHDIMTKNPITISETATLKIALESMENRSSQISVLPVTPENSARPSGLLRLHDIQLLR